MILQASKKVGYGGLYYLIPLFILLIFQEVVLRLVFPVPEVLNFNRINYSARQITPGMQRSRDLSNTSFNWTSAPDRAEFVHVLNLYGFRDSNWKIEKDPERLRIMFIGDSFVEGFMATQGNTIPDQVEKVAQSKGTNIEAMNMGIGASGISHYLDLIVDAVPLFRPDQVVLVFYANDFPGPVIHGSLYREPLKPIFTDLREPRILYIASRICQDQTVPRRWIAKPFPFLPAVPNESNPWSWEKRTKQYEKFVEPTIAFAMKNGQFNPFLVDQYVRLKKKVSHGI